MSFNTRMLCGCLVGLCAVGARAAAQSAAADPVSVRLRVALPLTQVTAINPGSGDGYGVGLVGGSIGAELHQLWAIEAGARLMLSSIYGSRPDLFARAGIAPVVADWRRPGGRGWTAQLDLLAGWRRLVRYQSPDGKPGSEVTSGLSANAGIELARHDARRVWTLRLLGGVTLPLTQEHTGDWATHGSGQVDLRYAVDLGVDLGVAF